jgi:hypothetical protein
MDIPKNNSFTRGGRMELTAKEKEICKKYRSRDDSGFVHCCDCPLALDHRYHECYANIDGRTENAKRLKRY